MLHIYKHTGEVRGLEHTVIVAAHTETQAAEIIRKELDSMGFEETAVNTVFVNQLFQVPSVIHSCSEDF